MLSGIYANRESAKLTGILDAISLHYADVAQRQSGALVMRRSRFRNSPSAPFGLAGSEGSALFLPKLKIKRISDMQSKLRRSEARLLSDAY